MARAAAEVSPALQQLWFALATRPWASLLLVPAHPGGSAFSTAAGLLEVGLRSQPGRKLNLLDARRVPLEETDRQVQQLRQYVAGGGRALVVVEAVMAVPSGLALAREAEAALVCITPGLSTLEDVRRTLALCGPERFIGSVLVHPSPKSSRR